MSSIAAAAAAVPSSTPEVQVLSKYLPFPHTPWKISPDLFTRAQESVQLSQRYYAVEVVNSDPEFNFVHHYFNLSKPDHYSIKRLVCIDNRDQQKSFEQGLETMEEEAKKLGPPKLEGVAKEDRKKNLERWKRFSGQFSPLQLDSSGKNYTQAKVLPLWYGTHLAKCQTLCSTGYAIYGREPSQTSVLGNRNSHSEDSSYFGNGFYFTSSVKQAIKFSPDGQLLLTWVSMREPYPIVSEVPHPQRCIDMSRLTGRGSYKEYNAHYAPVVSLEPGNPDCTSYYPCYRDQTPEADEVVVFHPSQALVRFWVELERISPQSSLSEVSHCKPVSRDLGLTLLFQSYQARAKQKDVRAYCDLGRCYATAQGVDQDYKEALKWFHKAAEQGDSDAELWIGICYSEGNGVSRDDIEALKWLQKAASKGNRKAYEKLEICYHSRRGVPPKDSLKWFHNLANHGDIAAQNYLGTIYSSTSPEEAVDWYRKAADRGYAAAQFNLGVCYFKGHGVKKDDQMAVAYYRKADSQGHKEAQFWLAICYYKGQGTSTDYTEAFRLFSESANKGDSVAQCYLGICYYKGHGVEQDKEEAVKLYQISAGRGYSLAQYYLASCLFHGEGIPLDRQAAVKYYEKSAKQGNKAAQYYLGDCYLKGEGVKPNTQEALKWFQAAANQGDADAKAKVDDILASKPSK